MVASPDSIGRSRSLVSRAIWFLLGLGFFSLLLADQAVKVGAGGSLEPFGFVFVGGVMAVCFWIGSTSRSHVHIYGGATFLTIYLMMMLVGFLITISLDILVIRPVFWWEALAGIFSLIMFVAACVDVVVHGRKRSSSSGKSVLADV